MESGSKKSLKRNRCIQLSKSLASCRTLDKANVIITCGEREFYAHKLVLESSTGYFVNVLQNGLQEAKFIKASVEDMQPETLDAILDFIYLGEVEKVSTESQLTKVVAASELLHLDELAQYCSIELGETLSRINFFDRFNFIRKYAEKGSHLESTILKFWNTNGLKMVSSNSFLSLPFLKIKEFLTFIAEARSSMDYALKGLVNWFHHDSRSREAFVDELFECFDATFVKKDAIMALRRETRTMGLSKNITGWLKALDDAVLDDDRQEIATRLAPKRTMFPNSSKLTYYSNYRSVEVFDPSHNCYVVTRSKPYKCVQQLDLGTMTWLPLQVPQFDSSWRSWNAPLLQFGPHVYTIGEKNSWDIKAIYGAQKNPLAPLKCPRLMGSESDTELCFFKDCLFAIGGSQKVRRGSQEFYRHTIFVRYIELGTGEWREAIPLNYVENNMATLASKNYIYVICCNPRIPDELIIQYSEGPHVKHAWGIIRVLRHGLEPSHFFVLQNTLNALYIDDENSKQLTVDHDIKKMQTKRPFSWPGQDDGSLVLSKFQNMEGSFVFFANPKDYFSIPSCFWEPKTGRWAKLPPPRGNCDIPNHKSVKMVYDIAII